MISAHPFEWECFYSPVCVGEEFQAESLKSLCSHVLLRESGLLRSRVHMVQLAERLCIFLLLDRPRPAMKLALLAAAVCCFFASVANADPTDALPGVVSALPSCFMRPD